MVVHLSRLDIAFLLCSFLAISMAVLVGVLL